MKKPRPNWFDFGWMFVVMLAILSFGIYLVTEQSEDADRQIAHETVQRAEALERQSVYLAARNCFADNVERERVITFVALAAVALSNRAEFEPSVREVGDRELFERDCRLLPGVTTEILRRAEYDVRVLAQTQRRERMR